MIKIYGSWDIEHDRQISGPFFAFLPPLPPPLPAQKMKIKIKMKKKKMPGDIIILHNCIKNHDHMLHCSWDMASDTFNFSFLAIFCPFTPQTAPNMKIPEIWYMTHVIVIFHFGLFFALSPLNSPKNQHFTKISKNPGDIILLRQADRQTDRKSDIERWVPHLKI